MIIAFAEFRGIKLCVFHGNRKVKHLDGGSDQCLTYFCWDNHCYFAQTSSGYYSRRCVDAPRESIEKVKMEQDMPLMQKLEASPWQGVLEPGLFLTENVNGVRDEWLKEGVVPRANVRGFNEFNSISRTLPEGECTVKSIPMYYNEIMDFMEKCKCRTAVKGLGWPR